MYKVCRTCLKVENDENCTYVSLNSVTPESNCLSVKEKLLTCVPELSVNVARDPSICSSCLNALQVTYEFWSLCLQTEEKIRTYMQKNARNSICIDLSELVEFEQSGTMEVEQCMASVEADCEAIEVECRSPHEMCVEPDLIDIKYIIPALPQEEDSVQGAKTEDEGNAGDGFDNSESFKNYSNQNEEIIEVIIKSEDGGETNSENDVQADAHACYVCGCCFTTKHSLNSHMKLHLSPKSKWRRGAKKKSTLPLKRLNEHLSREKEKRYMCQICDKNFLKKTQLRIHMNMHSGERPFKCDICDKKFNFKTNLQRHMLMHESRIEKRFKCNVCEKSFTRKEHLSKHVISHTDEMPHQCKLCNKLFKYKDSLRGHLKYHSGEKHFRCDICGNGFIRRDNLQVHLRTIHADEKPFECSTCKDEFSEKCVYENHMKLHTGRKYYKCHTCGKLCKTKHNLQLHSNIHLKVKPYKCSICNHTFSQKGTLTYHIRTHTGEKPYTCFVCERSFTQKATLRSHVQRHRRKSDLLVKDELKEEITVVDENAFENC